MPFFTQSQLQSQVQPNNAGTTPENNYGNVHFISFYSAVLSRFAYFSDKNFLEQYDKIIGPIIPVPILTAMNSISDIPEILDDEIVFDLKINPLNLPLFTYEGKKFIAFDDMAKKINMINGEVSETYKLTPQEESQRGAYNNVKYISIATSNYGEIYVIADKRMPTSIWIIFRGTYSGKTAGAYFKAFSLIPLYVGNSQGKRESYLYGIFKLLTDSIHTIIEAARYLAVNHLKVVNPESVKVFTTGHSLGGALSTLFAYTWMYARNTPPYNTLPYNVLTSKIGCISLGAPRCINVNISELFCGYVERKEITFLRITTRGDPVPSMPLKAMYFAHPCSHTVPGKKNYMREVISEDCNGLYKITMGKPGVYYDKSLDCSNKKGRAYLSNPLKHAIYLNILYRSAVDIQKFLTSTVTVAEIQRASDGKHSTECRLIIYDNDEKQYRVTFFNVNLARLIPVVEESQKQQSAGGISMFGSKEKGTGAGIFTPKDVEEDVRMTMNAFNKLIESATVFDINGPLPMQGVLQDPFKSETMISPKLCIKLTPQAENPETMLTVEAEPEASSEAPMPGGGRSRRSIRSRRSRKNRITHKRKSKITRKRKNIKSKKQKRH